MVRALNNKNRVVNTATVLRLRDAFGRTSRVREQCLRPQH